MSNPAYIAAVVSAETATKLMEGLSEGEQSAVSLICLTENLVDTISDIMTRLSGSDTLGSVFESMIRQLGTAAVSGCREHYSLTDEQIINCVDVAASLSNTIQEAAHKAAIQNELETNNAVAKH